MKRTVVQNGHPVLRQKAHEVAMDHITSAHIRGLIADMKELLSKEKYGVAIAAPQVGEALRLFIVSGKAMRKRRKRYADEAVESIEEDSVYINPVMTKMSRGKKDKHEGCLSVRGFWGEVPRAEKVTLTYLDETGSKKTRGASGFLAHIFQHETDHLDGILYTDKATHVYEETEEPDVDAAV